MEEMLCLFSDVSKEKEQSMCSSLHSSYSNVSQRAADEVLNLCTPTIMHRKARSRIVYSLLSYSDVGQVKKVAEVLHHYIAPIMMSAMGMVRGGAPSHYSSYSDVNHEKKHRRGLCWEG